MLQKIAYLYLILPLVIFSTTWFNFYGTSILVLSLLISCYFIRLSPNKYSLTGISSLTNKKIVLFAFIIASLWCFWSGIGGYIYQSGDFAARNAIYRDLIERSWPVYYKYWGGFALNYYFGFWIFPAFITKILYIVSTNHNLIFAVGLNILLIYSIIGVTIFLLLLVLITKPKNLKQLILVLIFPLFFSGLDIIGALVYKSPFFNIENFNLTTPFFGNMHIETYNGVGNIQYSSFTTQLFWVFNQCIPCWIITLLLLKDKTPENYGILATLGFFYCPLPMIGISIIMLTNCILFLTNNKEDIKGKIKKIISLSNIYILPTFIIIDLFISLNGAKKHAELEFKGVEISRYLLFIVLEFGCFLFFIFNRYKKNVLFYVTIISLSLLCLFSFNEGYGDFQMRTTIPFLLLLLIFILEYLLGNASVLSKIMLSIFLIIGACTPLVEFTRGVIQLKSSKSIIYIDNRWFTLDKTPPVWPYYNYTLWHPYNYKVYKMLVKNY